MNYVIKDKACSITEMEQYKRNLLVQTILTTDRVGLNTPAVGLRFINTQALYCTREAPRGECFCRILFLWYKKYIYKYQEKIIIWKQHDIFFIAEITEPNFW